MVFCGRRKTYKNFGNFAGDGGTTIGTNKNIEYTPLFLNCVTFAWRRSRRREHRVKSSTVVTRFITCLMLGLGSDYVFLE